jgi:hypothetical protein
MLEEDRHGGERTQAAVKQGQHGHMCAVVGGLFAMISHCSRSEERQRRKEKKKKIVTSIWPHEADEMFWRLHTEMQQQRNIYNVPRQRQCPRVVPNPDNENGYTFTRSECKCTTDYHGILQAQHGVTSRVCCGGPTSIHCHIVNIVKCGSEAFTATL